MGLALMVSEKNVMVLCIGRSFWWRCDRLREGTPPFLHWLSGERNKEGEEEDSEGSDDEGSTMRDGLQAAATERRERRESREPRTTPVRDPTVWGASDMIVGMAHQLDSVAEEKLPKQIYGRTDE